MIDRTHPLPVRRQCQLLKLARSTAYYPADAGLRDHAGVDTADRCAASTLSLCRGAHAARSATARGARSGATPGGHPDAAHGD